MIGFAEIRNRMVVPVTRRLERICDEVFQEALELIWNPVRRTKRSRGLLADSVRLQIGRRQVYGLVEVERLDSAGEWRGLGQPHETFVESNVVGYARLSVAFPGVLGLQYASSPWLSQSPIAVVRSGADALTAQP